MLLSTSEIRTTEVLGWRGLHLLHFSMSSCSQKVRILLREKELSWTSHPVNLTQGEQKTDWYRGINPNGVVPVLVHDGDVHIESNDILAYLDRTFPSEQGSYFPSDEAEKGAAKRLMELEDELHSDLRNITFTFFVPGKLMKDAPVLSEDEVDASIRRFRDAFLELEQIIHESGYLSGDRMMLPDIAWFISMHRLVSGGYPIDQHPRLAAWYARLSKRPSMSAEIAQGPVLARVAGQLFRWWKRTSRSSIRDRSPQGG